MDPEQRPRSFPEKRAVEIEPRSRSVLFKSFAYKGFINQFHFFFLKRRDIYERLAGQPDRPVDDTRTF